MNYRLVSATIGLGLISSFASAGIAPGDLVVYRVGDGSLALGTTTASAFLDEYTTTGALVQSIAITGAYSNVGNASSEGIVTRSQDGSMLCFTGYKIAGGTTGTAAFATNKVIGTVGLSGLVNTSVDVSDAGTSVTTRSATTVNGSAFYLSTSANVRYVGTPTSGATSQSVDARNSRQVMLSGNTLYASNGSTAITGKLQSYGTLPTGTTTASPVITLGTTDAINGFDLIDLSPGVAGIDTAYALSTVANTILKYSFDGTAWTAAGAVSASGAQNLTAMQNGSGGVDLFLTSGTTLSKLTDNSGYGGTLSGSLTTLATAGTNRAFRGLSYFVPTTPEPSTVAALGLGALALLRKRRSSK